ncbi:MAG: hypothetical protein HQ521_05325 [Bacteroidetes bacterium]|nr:hypothetical protein [Bacteroidota bacterium]
MATLYLHIGHGKTGTSWIQSSLHLSTNQLLSYGIVYPERPDVNIINSNTITSGNTQELLKSKSIFESTLAKYHPNNGNTLLFSSEFLFRQIINSNAEEFIEEVSSSNGFDKIKILLFIRNPISSAASVWQQRIKRMGLHQLPLTELHNNSEISFDKIFNVSKLLDRFSNLDSVELTVKNYSRCKNHLLEEVASWLGVPNETIQRPSVSRINRSMTYSELFMQQRLNSILGPSGKLFSDPLCEQFPNITPSSILPPLDVQKAIWEKVSPTIEQINKLLPKAHQYQCDIQSPEPTPTQLSFSNEQINLIAESLGGEILRLRKAREQFQQTIENLREDIGDNRSEPKKQVKLFKPTRIINSLFKRIKQSISQRMH